MLAGDEVSCPAKKKTIPIISAPMNHTSSFVKDSCPALSHDKIMVKAVPMVNAEMRKTNGNIGLFQSGRALKKLSVSPPYNPRKIPRTQQTAERVFTWEESRLVNILNRSNFSLSRCPSGNRERK